MWFMVALWACILWLTPGNRQKIISPFYTWSVEILGFLPLCVADTSCRAALSQFLLHFQVYEKGSGLSKFCLSMSTDSSVQIWALRLLLYTQCRSWGQQQWLFCCITQAQSGTSGVSSWMRKQNSSVRQNMLIATVLLSRGFVGLWCF